MDGGNTGDFKVKYVLKGSPTHYKITPQDFLSVLVAVFAQYLPFK
jgi:hypothetical protein